MEWGQADSHRCKLSLKLELISTEILLVKLIRLKPKGRLVITIESLKGIKCMKTQVTGIRKWLTKECLMDRVAK